MLIIINNKSSKSKLEKLEDYIKQKNKIIIMYIYADWCIYCVKFKPEWKDYIKKVSNNNNLKDKIVFVEVKEEYIKLIQKSKILKKFLKDFKVYPTVVFSNNNNKITITGDNKIKDIKKLVKENLKNISNKYNSKKK